jgi:hypothetical protein
MKKLKLLTRSAFSEAVFKRDNYTCVFCDQPAINAHHLLDRKLFDDGGYYLENGASVCGAHHLELEMTLISVERAREACGIKDLALPDHFPDDAESDKWGNFYLPNGQRLKGELFFEENVQKILKLAGVLSDFAVRIKYQKTCHAPWSESVQKDDRRHKNMAYYEGKRVIVTRKMDGENTSLYWDYTHAKSIDSAHHPSRDWVKNFWSKIRFDIPEGWRICGENMFAEHSIRYENLESYFFGFMIFDERNIALSWDETLVWFDLIGITPVEVIYDGIYDEAKIKAAYAASGDDWATSEGYVIRIADSFSFSDFRRSMAKYVRKNHVATNEHWMFGEIKPNGLARK